MPSSAVRRASPSATPSASAALLRSRVERRLEIVGDVVGDLPQSLVQLLDALQHGIQRHRQAVEFIAGSAHRQALRQVAGHDLLAGIRHAVNAFQRVAADAEPDDDGAEPHDRQGHHQRLAHQQTETLGVAEVAADQDSEAIVEHENIGDCLVAALDTPAVSIALVAEGRGGPADLLEDTRLHRGDVAGENIAGGTGDDVEVGSRLACTPLHRAQEKVHAAGVIGALHLLHLLPDGVADLARQQPLRHRRHIEDERRGADGEKENVECRKADCCGLEENPETAHPSSLIMYPAPRMVFRSGWL